MSLNSPPTDQRRCKPPNGAPGERCASDALRSRNICAPAGHTPSDQGNATPTLHPRNARERCAGAGPLARNVFGTPAGDDEP
jgi:hypothetical protein